MASVRSCPVYTPSITEFLDFNAYIASIEGEARQYGVCRIRPPPEWTARNSGYANVDFKVSRPVQQQPQGRDGTYQLLLIMKRNQRLSDLRLKAEKGTQPPQPPTDADGKRDYQSRAYIEQVEKRFWGSMHMEPPIYGADSEGSLFDEAQPSWNLAKLDTLLSRKLAATIPGVNTPFMYVGTWRAMFAWHTEDMDLYSINFLHFGLPKIWYSVAVDDAEAFESCAKTLFPEQHKACSQYLRHKQTVIHPRHLLAKGIDVARAVHEPGEFVITFPRAYHCGYNAGFNCAEAINFANESWVEIGKQAIPCRCTKGAVRFDMRIFEDLTWIECDACTKWRLLADPSAVDPSRPFECTMLGGKTCEMDEDVEPSTEESDLWVQCDDCDKWRRLDHFVLAALGLGNHSTFRCADVRGLHCDVTEESWPGKFKSPNARDDTAASEAKPEVSSFEPLSREERKLLAVVKIFEKQARSERRRIDEAERPKRRREHQNPPFPRLVRSRLFERVRKSVYGDDLCCVSPASAGPGSVASPSSSDTSADMSKADSECASPGPCQPCTHACTNAHAMSAVAV